MAKQPQTPQRVPSGVEPSGKPSPAGAASFPTPQITNPGGTKTTVVKADSRMGAEGPADQEIAQRLGTPVVQQTDQTQSIINAAAIYLYRQARFQPIASLDPQALSWQLSEWNVGTFRRFSLTMDAIENRDALTKSVTGKLKHSLSRRSYEIVKVEDADEDEAEAHAQALEVFYSNVEATNAIDRNMRGGFSTLLGLMMDCALKKYSTFEIVWKIGTDQNGEPALRATFVFVPLWFFENRTGSLRFCGNFAWDGIPLKDGNWMVCVGDGIMEAIAVAWMYKTIATRDWLIYSEKHGMPGIVGQTPNAKDSPGWNAIEEAVRAVASDFSAVIGIQDKIEAVQFGQTGQLPYPPLVEYMDRCISALARGADLSTMSSGHGQQGGGGKGGQGASLQGDESALIEEHYGQNLSETLQRQVDINVLKWYFGEDVIPAAYCKVNIPPKKDAQVELAIDAAMTQMGVMQSKTAVAERYSRTEASEEQIAEGDVVEKIVPPQGQNGNQNGQGGDGELDETDEPGINESRRLLKLAAANMANTAPKLKKIAARIQNIANTKSAAQYKSRVNILREQFVNIDSKVDRTIENANALLEVHEILQHPWVKK